MVSRRNLITIILMMMTIFFMFQFSQVVKVRNNQYDTNLYAKENILISTGKFIPDSSNECVVFIGDEKTQTYDVVKEWSEYGKKYLKQYSNLESTDDKLLMNASLILIDSKTVDCKENVITLEEMTKNGTTMVFLNTPSSREIKFSRRLKRLFGISKVREEEVEAKGFQVFEGFLLGGEAAYKPQKEEEEKYNDLQMNVPWYETGKGTKTYAVAMMDENEFKANEFPKLIWRNNYNGTFIYVVAADVINKETGMGFLSAIDYCAKDYSIYPVVNAQNFVLADYPIIVEENTDKIKEVYSMNAMSLSRDITWPVFVSIANRYNLKFTGFTNTGYNYTSVKNPDESYLKFYLQQFKEIDGEMGISLNTEDNTQLKNKITHDEEFLKGEGDYHYSALFAPDLDDNVLSVLDDDALLKDVYTIVSKADDSLRTVSYIEDTVTFQGITNIADEYTYSKELKHRSMLTAIGYSTTLIDMHKVLYPEKKEDEWQNFSKEISANIHTFWARNREFEFTAVSESDTRVREFLNLKYSSIRADNVITLKSDCTNDAYYVLRTHGEKVVKVEGGDYSVLEEDAYLIHANKGITMIYLGESDGVFKYDGLLK